MLASAWAMILCAAVLALKLFPTIYGPRVECQAKLVALLGLVPVQLERASSTPSHIDGIGALIGQHHRKILRTRAQVFREKVQRGLPVVMPLETVETPSSHKG